MEKEVKKLPIKPSAAITKILFSGDDIFELKKNEKIIIVGPNNSGKSQALREVLNICKTGNTKQTLVIKNLIITKEGGTSKQLQEFLESNAKYENDSYILQDWRFPKHQINFWDQPYLKAKLSNGYIKNITTQDRLIICDQQHSISPGEQKNKPQHILYDDSSMMGKISDLFRNAFGEDLIFDFRGGSKLPIHIGQLSEFKKLADRVSNEYVTKVRKLPLLDQQGDGMKSYAGILFESIVNPLDITLIDEPEAFLHPPQMRRLGETLASEVKGQLFVATHSSDILKGFLEGTEGKVRIFRITREKNVNVVKEASSDTIKELWEKPVLKYSNALDGIFHDQTIICEDDSDCKLINCMADHLSSKSQDQWLDTSYVPTGGKQAISKIASVLRKVGVPVKAVFDIDFLFEKPVVKETVEAFGGEWNEIETLWTRLDLEIRKGVKSKSNTEIKDEIIKIIYNSKEDSLPKSDIRDALKQDKPWNEVKRFGNIAIPKGDAQKNYRELINKLEEIGIYLIPVGEIENFSRDIGLHGPKFVAKLLSSKKMDDSSLSELQEFVKRIHTGAHCKFKTESNFQKRLEELRLKKKTNSKR